MLPAKPGIRPAYGQYDFTPDQRTNRWLAIASGQSEVVAPIRFTRDATLLVTRLEDHTLRHVFEPGRLGFLFVAEGAVNANAMIEERCRPDTANV